MSYPTIIIGAGASHDYTHDSLKRFPITDELVSAVFLDTEISDKYEEVNNIFSEIRPIIIKRKKSFEDCLQSIKDEIKQYPERKIQLMSLMFYLRDFFEKASSDFSSVNNYKALIDKINRYSGGNSCIINFNYDTLFERSFGYDCWSDMGSYISGSLRLIKLHGSHDWAYVGERKREKLSSLNITDSYKYLKRYPDHISNLQKNNIYPYHIKQLKKSEMFRFPAIAIPLPEKQNYICPPEHIDFLKQALGKTDRILIIGWAARDQKLFDLIKENINKKIPITIVSGNIDSSKSIKEKFQSMGSSNCYQFDGGFTDFVASDDFKKFFEK